MKSYTCESCGGSFICESSDEDKEKEFEKNFGKKLEEVNTEEVSVVCDDCYNLMMANLFN